MKQLNQKEIQENLKKVNGWVLEENKIKKLFVFNDFTGAMSFVNTVADLAEKDNHHPEILIEYNKVEITLWTHEARGLSEKDFSLASKIDHI